MTSPEEKKKLQWAKQGLWKIHSQKTNRQKGRQSK